MDQESTMKANRTGWSRTGFAAVIGVSVLTAAALALPLPTSPEHIRSGDHTYVLPASAEVSRTLLSDGRTLEVHGAEGVAYLMGDHQRTIVKLPEARRFGSITVMPNGLVLFWGGIDAQGHVFDSGEWFNPDTQHFVRTGPLGLPARAAHTLTVLTDGTLLMTGGWSSDGIPATTAVVWQEASHLANPLPGINTPRLDAIATLQADGSVRIENGVDAKGQSLHDAWTFHPDVSSTLASKQSSPSLIAETRPFSETHQASIHGPLVLRFTAPVDLKQLNTHGVTLLGPEGTVPVHVIGTEAGRLAFVQLPDDLYPGSRYTLFVKGLHTATGTAVPYTTVGFTTTSTDATGVVVAGHGGRPAPEDKEASPSLPPLYVMAGGDHAASCAGDTLCRPHSFVRDGAFYPGKNNTPDFTGAHWRLYAPYQHLPDTHALEAALPKGITTLVGQVRQIDETPVANAEVSIGETTVRTDAQGVFVLSNIPAGREELLVDGAPASHGDVKYGRFVVGADVKARAISHMPFVMYLPRILPRDEITLPTPTTREVVLTHPDMPGLELHVPAGAVFKDRKGHVLTHIALVPTPVDHAPFPLPDNFPMYFTIQPGDAVVQGLTPEAARGIRVVYPNYGKAKASAPADFWVYSVKEGWQMYGSGHVTADTKHLAPDPGVTLAWALGAGASQGTANPPTTQKPDNCSKGQPIDLQTGILFHEWNDFAINDVMPLTLTRAYTSADPNSHAFGVGGNANFGIHLWSAGNLWTSGGSNSNTSMSVVLPCGEGITYNQISGGDTWPLTGALWEHTGTKSAFYGSTIQFLLDNTPLGAHWLLTMKDGTQYAFTRHVPNSLSWVQDRYGNQIQFSYNGGLVQQMMSPSGRSITFNYDGSNRITSATDNSGRTIGYAYNSAGSLATVTYPDQTTEQYTYDSNNRMLTMQDRRGHVWVTNQYDANGRVTKQTYADNTSYQFAYATDSNNNVTATTVTDPNGNLEKVAFDSVSGYPSSDTRAYGTSLAQTTTFNREPSGLVDSVTDALNRTTTYTHDALGNVTSITRLSGTSNAVTTSFTYTSDYNQLASVTDPLGHATHFSYTNGCLTQVTDALGHSTTIQCNEAGQPLTVQDALGNSVTFAYQGYDLQSITDPLSRTTHYVMDTLGRRIATRDALSNVTLTQYDTNDRAVSATDALNQTTTLNYDGNGNLLSVTLPNTGVIHYAYDNRNRLITRTDAMNQSESWTYDGLGHVLTHTDRKGQVTDVSYDALNRRSLVSYADGSGIQSNYDAGNRLTSLTDSTSGTLDWGYDGLDRVTSTSSTQGSISYTYDAAGRRTSMTAASQATANYTFDDANRLTAIMQGSETVQLAYDADNRRTTLTLPNGVKVNYGYDNASELTGLTYTQSNGNAVGNLAYGYDADGRITSKSGSFAMDVLPTATTQPATFDLNDRKTSFNGQAVTYDANGNLISDGTNTYTWNARNQLTQISQGGNTQLSFSYDALGRRISKSLQGTTTQFLYDGNNAVQEAQGSAINPILVGLGIDERFARNDVTGRTYLLTDLLNSTIALTDPNGAVKQQYGYDPYGNVTPSDTATGFTNPYQYTGREADAPGLYYYRARYYSPMMAGFISEDPITFGGGQLSFYAYAGGNPVSYRDPSGRFGVLGFAIGVAAGGFAGWEAGGWKGAVTGALVGGLVGIVAPEFSAEAGGAVAAALGSETAGSLAAGATFVATNAGGGAAATVMGNLVGGKDCLLDGWKFGAAVGGFAPLMSGEAFFIAAGGEEAFGGTVANGYAVASGVAGGVGGAMDPGAEHGFAKHSEDSSCGCEK
ncbi:RHS repeat-associated core domain-containing protein [Burkholderia pseudomallei]|uniref:RHS repeat-associated core domain-containing protein n=1 Tax=Burkholderia pseudomallei TaxID=28450 RepID=UPI001E5210E2|nr:RHS repeat-associated core domain-containing protein [Burkholderia pseudomallei]